MLLECPSGETEKGLFLCLETGETLTYDIGETLICGIGESLTCLEVQSAAFRKRVFSDAQEWEWGDPTMSNQNN